MTVPIRNGIKGLSDKGLHPSKLLQEEIEACESALGDIPHFLSFGGLYAIVYNQGIIPDTDLDYSTFYGQDYKKIMRAFESHGYVNTKVMLDNTNPNNALYMGFNRKVHKRNITADAGKPKAHVCVSFLYPSQGMRWYCHDSNGEISGVGTPTAWSFRGVPAEIVEDEGAIIQVEWPGIPGSTKVSVPLMGGTLLDYLYIASPYKKQKYNVVDFQPEWDKMKSIYSGGACSRYAVELNSIAQFWQDGFMQKQMATSKKKWLLKRKQLCGKAK